MRQLRILSDFMYAGHCTSGGSNKDWAACLAVEVDDQNADPPNINETTKVVYLSMHGPHGGNLIADPPKELVMKQALPHFTKKCREKDGKAYAHVPFAPYLPAFGRSFGLALVLPSGETPSAEEDEAPVSIAIPAPALRYQACVVKAISLEHLHELVRDPGYGVTEKVNGERFMSPSICWNGKRRNLLLPPMRPGSRSLGMPCTRQACCWKSARRRVSRRHR